MRNLSIAVVVAAISTVGVAGLVADEVPYHTQFENEWVKLVRVRYPANSTVPLHDHPPTITTYVYLSESSPVRFTHPKENNRVATRQPTTPGGIRVSRGGNEVHTVENLGPLTSDFLRVEFKTDPAGEDSPFFRDNQRLKPGASTATEVRFTNKQMRLTRVAVPAGGAAQVVTPEGQPALLIALDSGKEQWIAAGRTEKIASGSAAAEFLRVDLLTAPIK